MKLLLKKTVTIFILACIIVGAVFSPIQPSLAANNMFNPSFAYNQTTGKWDISWMPIDGTSTFTISWHRPDGTVETQTGTTLALVNGKNIASISVVADHIYDLAFSFKDSDDAGVLFNNRFSKLVDTETVYFLSDITFEGTSFNDSAVLGGLSDGTPNLIKNNDDTQVIRIISGQKPKITLRWKVPTIWEPTQSDILPITHRNVNYDPLESENSPHIDLDYTYFHIQMNEVTDIVTGRDYRTTVTEDGSIIVNENGKAVNGFDTDGNITSDDKYVYITLDQTDGIIPGTEYEKINIRMYFWNIASNEQAFSSRLVYGSGQGFFIENKDYVFQTIEGRIDSIFTPTMYEVSKVDVDKMEVRIFKIKSKNYTELYYQVQDAGSIVDLIENSSNISSGIKVPDASIPDATGWGSVIIEIPLDQNGEHPQRYYRIVVTDGNSHTPLGSLALDLRLLGNDTGKPPVPREIEILPRYDGKQDVFYQNPAEIASINIPLTDLRIFFEKPLMWRTQNWADIVSAPDNDNDITFHLLLNTYLSDDVKIMETRTIGDEQISVYVPVKEKRMLTIGKHQLHEDPDDAGRLYFDVHGDNLFHDLVLNTPLDYENDIDYDINGNPDYPNFLLPNTVYYLRMFSARMKHKDEISWVNREEIDLEEKISYISPVVSFTTYPLREMPVPLPNMTLGVDVDPQPDPVTGKPVLNGITVSFPKILGDNDWLNYTTITENRKIIYDLYISDSTDEDSFILLEPPFVDFLETLYPDENTEVPVSTLVTGFPGDSVGELKPNTTYYFKVRAKLYVGDETAPFILSDETPVKSITTPKTDSGDLDDSDRLPRTPVEFSIARDEDGEMELTDAKVTLNWLHAEQDVTYEMVCTTKKLSAGAVVSDYINDEYNNGTTENPGFLRVYKNYKTNETDTELNINVLNTNLKNVGFTYNVDNTRVARLPVNLPFLKPNHLYYFSLRAVRNRGTENAVYSSWVSIPVTTKMVQPPGFFEVINDVQLGFRLRNYSGIRAEDMKIMLKKRYQKDSAYYELSRSKYSVVKDGSSYYFRLYDLDPDTWYDIKPFYAKEDMKYWYDSDDKAWYNSGSDPVKMKTRDTLHEIEVRFEGESLYDYFLEMRNDDDNDYVILEFDEDADENDFGYVLEDGSSIDFYLEKTYQYVEDGLEDRYIYYAKISNTRRKRSDGTYTREALLANTRYYIKVWARNIEDSKHIGPVTIRTDFSQDDYDKDHIKNQIEDAFNQKADNLTRKLYFTVNESDKTANRFLLKGARISNLMRMAGHSGITVDISKERPEVLKDVILIPYEVLDTIGKHNTRLTIKLLGCELTLTGDSLELEYLKQLASATNVKEAMLEITVERKKAGSISPAFGFTYGSQVYDISMEAVGVRRTYAEINEIIYDILKEPEETGPFKYGIFDRKLAELMNKQTTSSYKNQIELENILNIIMDEIEEELSFYIKDILDGGRGFSASVINRKQMPELGGGFKLKLLHQGYEGLVEPYVLYKGKTKWEEPGGLKAWMFPYILITVNSPGEYTIFNIRQVDIPSKDGVTDPSLQRFAQKYNLQTVFGSRTLYPGDYVSRDNAIILFEVVTGTENEVAGLSNPAKIRYYNLEQILPVSVIQPAINREQATSVAVEIYAYKSGISAEMIRPMTRRYIKNGDRMSDSAYHRLVIALDLGITRLEPDNTYDGAEKITVEEMLKEIIVVLELLGEW